MPYQVTLNKEIYFLPIVEELSIDEFIKLAGCKRDIDKLELLLNANLSELSATPKTTKQVSGILALIDGLEKEIEAFLKGEINPEENISFKILNTKIELDSDLGKLPYWAMVKVKAMIKEMGDEPFNKYEHYKNLVAHFTYCLVTKFKYNEYKAEEYANDVIGGLPFQMVVRLGDFFLYTQHRSWMRKQDYWTTKVQMLKKKLALKFSINTGR